VSLLPELFAERAVCVLTRVGQSLNRLIEIRLDPLGLKLRHYTVLRSLASEGVMSQQELGELLTMDPATTATTVDELEQYGLLARKREPANRRKYAVAVTDSGRRMLARAERALDALETDVLVELDEAERAGLRGALFVLAYGERYPALVRAEAAAARETRAAPSGRRTAQGRPG
jgi:DNA-binding MarR family transcriptional regulator